MVEGDITRKWLYRAGFVALAALFFFLRILPLDSSPTNVPGPDLMLAMTMAWVLRRPDYAPALLIVAVFLLEDMLYQRPPGLWTAIVLLGSEFLRGRVALMRGLPFLLEWALVTALILVMTFANRLVMALVLLPQAALPEDLLRALTTILVFPVILVLTRLVFDLSDSDSERHGA